MTNKNSKNNFWMNHAISLANYAYYNGEIPVGAVLILNNKILGEGWNSSISLNDPSAHAEILALRQSANLIKNYRLINTSLYVTLEPCIMCIGAIINARISNLIIGAKNKNNSIKTILNIIYKKHPYNKLNIYNSLLEKKCSKQIKNFFKKKRKNNKIYL